VAALALAGTHAAWQETYGATSGGGLSVDLGVTIRPLAWLSLRLFGRYAPLFLSLAGGSQLATSAVDQQADGCLEVGLAL
jgi:hypothetical protein